ncbi:hypothetical protein MPSEU_000356500 [Mayamaea pseudoterrestris]|nr:hypothetical protein MPSEU_000356500 [Mayamaea pseudoterrestris]
MSSTAFISSSNYTNHKSLAELVDRYDGFILDQFGVMHNGANALDGAVDCVRQLCHAHGKRLVILSNSSSLAHDALHKLSTLGFDANDFLGAVTSGQEASEFIRASRFNNINQSAPTKALFFTWESSASLEFLQACGDNLEATDNVSEADFILLHGSQVLRGPQGEHGQAQITPLDFFDAGNTTKLEPILQQCMERNLEMVCCNPDYVYVSPDGSIKHMPGTIADLYQNKYNGTVHTFGKPHVPHFDACVRLLNLGCDRIAHVGDSLHHDVKGANAAGMASILLPVACIVKSWTCRRMITFCPVAASWMHCSPSMDKLRRMWCQCFSSDRSSSASMTKGLTSTGSLHVLCRPSRNRA